MHLFRLFFLPVFYVWTLLSLFCLFVLACLKFFFLMDIWSRLGVWNLHRRSIVEVELSLEIKLVLVATDAQNWLLNLLSGPLLLQSVCLCVLNLTLVATYLLCCEVIVKFACIQTLSFCFEHSLSALVILLALFGLSLCSRMWLCCHSRASVMWTGSFVFSSVGEVWLPIWMSSMALFPSLQIVSDLSQSCHDESNEFLPPFILVESLGWRTACSNCCYRSHVQVRFVKQIARWTNFTSGCQRGGRSKLSPVVVGVLGKVRTLRFACLLTFRAKNVALLVKTCNHSTVELVFAFFLRKIVFLSGRIILVNWFGRTLVIFVFVRSVIVNR